MSIKKAAERKSIRLLRKRNELLSVDVLLKNKSAVGRNNLTGHVRSGKKISECAGDIGNITDESLGNGARKCVELILVNAAEHVCHVKEAHEVGVDNVLILLSLDVDPVAVICDACA